MEKTKNKLPSALLGAAAAPLAIIVIILLAYLKDSAYPFGEGTVAWCDMLQQVVPLLIDFKDILAGKDGVFLNFQNAAGMNMWAVIFFFLASPFSLLTAFVSKTDMLFFANILVMLKLAACGAAASFYLYKTCRKLSPVWIAALGVLYGLSGYGLLYYQNVIWLDMMYLFPLLLLSLESLCEKKRVLPYALVLAAMIAVNYYIGYMVVIFIMLFIALALTAMRTDETGGDTAVRFVLGSVMAAFLTAVVWLPSLLQYTRSGRVKEEFFSSIKESGFLTSFETILPTILCSAFVIAAVIIFSCDGKPRTQKHNIYLILAALTLIPLFTEPVNLMWHTGSYMSFPSRFGFITEFMLVACTAFYLDDKDGLRTVTMKKHYDNAALLLGLLGLTVLFAKLLTGFLEKKYDDATAYVRSLWGNRGSLEVCFTVFVLTAAMSVLMITLYRKGFISSNSLAVLCAVLICSEAYTNTRIYLSAPARIYPDRAASQNKVYDLADKLDDTGMFRVKTDGKLFYVNLAGTLGYGSISHYTSLNDQDYMFTMKRLGYSSNWMDVGSYGGTELTDMLMSIKYRIIRGEADNAVYSNDEYSIVPMEAYLPSGLVINDIDNIRGELPELTRGELQKFIYDNTLLQYGEEAVQYYEFEETVSDSGYTVSNGSSYMLTADVKGSQSLYFDAFDHPEVALGSSVDGSFNVLVNTDLSSSDYPSGDFNGMWKLGDFENEQVDIIASSKRDISMKSLGVTAIDKDKLYAAAADAKTVGFTQKGGRLTGTVEAKQGQYCLINVPYTDGLKVSVNGKSTECIRVLGDFAAVRLEEGTNEIKVRAVPKGFIPGLILTLIGAALCVLWHFVLSKKLKIPAAASKLIMWAVTAAGAAVFMIVYIVPVILNVTRKE